MRLALLAPLVLLATSCQTAPGRYFAARAGDLSDAIQLAFGGPAIGAHVEATVLANTGLDVWRAYGERGGSFGNFASRVPGSDDYAAYSIVLFHARGHDADPTDGDPENPDDFPPPHAGFPTHVHELGRAFDRQAAAENLEPLRWLDVEVSAGAFVGARARFSPGELVDFLAGWFGLDLAGDDGRE